MRLFEGMLSAWLFERLHRDGTRTRRTLWNAGTIRLRTMRCGPPMVDVGIKACCGFFGAAAILGVTAQILAIVAIDVWGVMFIVFEVFQIDL